MTERNVVPEEALLEDDIERKLIDNDDNDKEPDAESDWSEQMREANIKSGFVKQSDDEFVRENQSEKEVMSSKQKSFGSKFDAKSEQSNNNPFALTEDKP